MNFRHMLHLMMAFSLLFQSSSALTIFDTQSQARAGSAVVPTVISPAVSLGVKLTTPGSVAYTAYLPIRRKSGDEPASQLPAAPAVSPLEALQAASATNGVMFIENVGQFDPQMRFLVRGDRSNLFLADDALWLTVLERSQETLTPIPEIDARQATDKDQARKAVNLKMSFIGANPHPRLESFNRRETHVSYFIGDDPAKWQADVPMWGGVRYVDLYPGIDLELINEQGQLQQRLIVRDSTQLDRVRLKVDGAEAVATHRVGNRAILRLATTIGNLDLPLFEVMGVDRNSTLAVPAVQDNVVEAPFANAPMHTPGLQNPYQSGLNALEAITNTADLLYSTFMGGSGSDVANSVAVDRYGAIYVAGCTWSSDFVTKTNSYDVSYNGPLIATECGDAFVTKIDTTGGITLAYSTFLGTSSEDDALGIAVNANGEAYVTGFTKGTDFPLVNPYTTTVGSGAVFVTKFNMTGTALLFSTFLGLGTGQGIAVDANGNAAIVGQTQSITFPVKNAYNPNLSNPVGYTTPPYDVFVTQLNPSQSGNASLLYSTYLGGGQHDCNSGARRGCAVAVDSSGKIYVAGRTQSNDFPITPLTAYQPNSHGGSGGAGWESDVFISRIDPTLAGIASLAYSTYLGGSEPDCRYTCAIAVDSQGMAYITGETQSTNFPTTTLALQKTLAIGGGNYDAFVAKIDTTKSQTASLVYSTYLGGNGADSIYGSGIAVDSTGRAYVAGDTTSTNLTTMVGAYQTTLAGGRDAFVATINPSGSSLDYATYLGGTGDDMPYGIVANAIGIYIAGCTTSVDYPYTSGAIQSINHGGTTDAFVTVLRPTVLLDMMVRTLSCPLCSSFNVRNHLGHPIDTLSGNYTYQKLDQSIPVLDGSLTFERSYSADTRSLFTRTLGYGWTHNQEIRLAFPPDLDGVTRQVLLQAPGGSQLPFFGLGNGRYQPYPGVTASLSRITATGSITTYVVTATNQTIYTFNAAGLITQSVNPAGNVISYTYYLTGPLQSVQSYGRSLRFTYDTQNRLTKVLDPINRATQFIYDSNGDLVNVVDTRNLTWTYQYSGTTHLLSRIFDPDQKTVERTVFDGQGRAIQQYNGRDELIVKLDFGAGGVITATDGLTRTAVDRYGRGTWLGGTDAATQAITRTYDANFKPTYVADPNGHGPQIKWSANGSNLERVVDGGGYTTTMQYDGLNNPTLITDTRSFTTAYVYSGTFLMSKIDAMGNTWIYTPTNDGRNLLAAELAPGGRLTEYQYDPFGQRKVITDALKNVARYEYDPVGRLITTTDAIGRITVNAYDPADHLIAVTNNFTMTSVQQNLSNTWNLITRYGYDGFGRQIAVTDTLNHITRNYFDGAGRLISVTANFTTTGGVDPNVYNLKTWYGYDAVGNQIAVTDTLLHVTVTEYDNLNRPVTVTQNYKGNGFFDPSKPDENVKRITHYDPAGNVIEQIDPLNASGESRVTRNWYDSLNRVISTTANFTTVPGADPSTYNLTTWYEYDQAGNQVAITDTQQHVTRNYYDPLGQLISTTMNYRSDAGPNYLNQYNLTTQYEYDAVGNRVAITDPLTSTIRYTYDKLNRVIATTNVSGTATIKYDAIGNRVAVTDALTHTTVYTYNAVGQLIAEGNPVAGNITRYQYEALGRTIIVTDALTHPTRTFYDAAGRVVSTTNALTGTMVITYNALGQQVGYLNENSKASYTAYDGLGRTIVVTDATGGATSFGYDAVGNRTIVTDASTRPLTSTYDVANRLIQVQDALGNTTRYGYDNLGNRVVMTDANGIATGYGYDAVSRLSVVTESITSTLGLDPNQYNLLTRYGYDPIGNRSVMTNARGYTTTYRYDALSRLIAMSDPLTHTTWYQYDAVGNRTKVIDANNQTTVYTYDVLNRNTQIDYGASLVKFEYDPVGNRKVMTDSLGVTRYLYDALNRPISITDALTGTVQYRYDDVGNRTRTIYPDGKIVTSTFDAANRLTQTLSWDGQLTKYAFDKAGRLVTTTWPISNIQSINTYDAAGRLVNLTHQGPYWLLATYTYTLDAVGNRLAVQERLLPPTPFVYLPMIMKDDGGEQMMAPPGQIAPFDSPLAVPAPFQSPLPTPTTTGSAGIPASPIADLTLLVMAPTVVAALVGRRQKGRKWTLPLAVLAGALITGGLTQTSGAAPVPMPFFSPQSPPPPGCTLPTAVGDTRVISYTYDPLSRLTNAAYSSGECYQYAYDRVGNRTAMTTTVGATTYQYDVANRPINAGGVTYTWDNNGNLINDGSALYRYDQANRLISTTLNSATSLYAYNGDGVRLKQIVAGAVTTYTQDVAAPLPVVLQSRTGVTTTKYLYSEGTRPLAQNATAWEYLLPDALGSVRQIANTSGYINLTKDYGPYGSVLNSSGSSPSAYGFTGEQRDHSGLIYLRARYMQPALGIFLARDPWSGDVLRPGSMNGYSYTEGNPVNRADPSGLCSRSRDDNVYCWWLITHLYSQFGIDLFEANRQNPEYYIEAYLERLYAQHSGLDVGVIRYQYSIRDYTLWYGEELGGCIKCHVAKDLGHIPNNNEMRRAIDEWQARYRDGVTVGAAAVVLAYTILPTCGGGSPPSGGTNSLNEEIDSLLSKSSPTQQDFARLKELVSQDLQSAGVKVINSSLFYDAGHYVRTKGASGEIVLGSGASTWTKVHEWIHFNVNRMAGYPGPLEDQTLEIIGEIQAYQWQIRYAELFGVSQFTINGWGHEVSKQIRAILQIAGER
jgi:RHS repeat-associated protein